MLTLFYVGATFYQAWRIKNVCTKISQQLAQQSSISFYRLPNAATDDGYDIAVATSELCINRQGAKVSELLWLSGNQRGCCVCPVQTLNIMPWISFPETVGLLPFAHNESTNDLLARALKTTRKRNIVYLLLETEISPCYLKSREEEFVRLEEYGKLIAWKIDSHLAVLIETDVEHFTKLLMSTFLQSNLLINDQLPLLRIESVNYEGKPQPFELLSSHLRKPMRTTGRLSDDEWLKHLEDLRAVGVLAHQATEFESKKNLSEGKTVPVKPDLIPLEKRASETPSPASATAIAATKTTTTSSSTTNAKTADISSPVKKETLTTAAPVAIKTSSTTAEEKTQAPAPAPAPTPTPAAVKVDAGKSVTASPTTNKMKTKPTEIKKPVASTFKDSGRFKTTKVCESSALPKTTSNQATVSSTTTAATPPSFAPVPAKSGSPAKAGMAKVSELEKIAATAVTQKQQSPLHAAASTSNAATSVTPAVPTAAVHEIITEKSKQPSSSEASGSTSSTVKASPSSIGSKESAKRPSLKRNKSNVRESKPLNILVYSDSASARESTVVTLKDLLEKDMYTIYPLTSQQVVQKYWLDNTALLVVCGAVATNIGEILVDYFLHGGRVLSLCSDILHFVLPNYRTAEVREHELVQFSYDKWQKVKMMHHIFCYQPSPIKKNFSTDSDDSAQLRKQPALVCPRSIELKDLLGTPHNLDVRVLGTEETWNTPSLLLANNAQSGGKAVFSQVHLETNPSQFETDESKYNVLKQNEKVRLEIFSDLLNKHLDVNVRTLSVASNETTKCVYKNAYFLGRHESKFELLQKLQEKCGSDNVITTSKLTMKFCGKDDKPPNANTSILPILIHSCPEDFSTVDYFENLKTNYIGRLVIYAPIVSSSMNVINELELTNGIAVLPRQQTEGTGRSVNQWLSPLGCAMFSIQLHISLDSFLGARLPLIQHIIGAACVNALRSHNAYKNLDINLKWPNDMYANGVLKIGGLIVKTTLIGKKSIINIGVGINLDNTKPTTCINDLIAEKNRATKQNIPKIKYEQFIAMIFNSIESLVEQVQTGDFEQFYKLYYQLWLHNEQKVTICDKDGKKKEAEITGIDEYGYLTVRTTSGATEIVQPDGNSFDMLKGLIVPKFN